MNRLMQSAAGGSAATEPLTFRSIGDGRETNPAPDWSGAYAFRNLRLRNGAKRNRAKPVVKKTSRPKKREKNTRSKYD